jgi:predicted alpha/beta hydrolase family esterase
MIFGNRSNTSDKDSLIGLQKIGDCENPNRRGDVIFVHGLGGNLWSTWHPEEKIYDDNFWLSWLSKSQQEIGIWSFGYESQPSKWTGRSMSIFDQAGNLLKWVENRKLGEKPLIFVAHSLGGLLVKEMLYKAKESEKQEIIKQIKGIVFLATPHTGSYLANLIDKVNILFKKTIIIDELKADSAALAKLNDWYRKHVRDLGIVTEVYFETKPVYGVLVVTEGSANPGIEGVDPIAVPDDHITIAKPRSEDSFVYLGVKCFIQKHFQLSMQISESVSPSQKNSPTSQATLQYLKDSISLVRIFNPPKGEGIQESVIWLSATGSSYHYCVDRITIEHFPGMLSSIGSGAIPPDANYQFVIKYDSKETYALNLPLVLRHEDPRLIYFTLGLAPTGNFPKCGGYITVTLHYFTPDGLTGTLLLQDPPEKGVALAKFLQKDVEIDTGFFWNSEGEKKMIVTPKEIQRGRNNNEDENSRILYNPELLQKYLAKHHHEVELQQHKNAQPNPNPAQPPASIPTQITYDLRGANIGNWAENQYGTQQTTQIPPNPTPFHPPETHQ